MKEYLQRRIPESRRHPVALAAFCTATAEKLVEQNRGFRTRKISCRNASSADWCDMLAPIYGSPVKTRRFCGPLISGAGQMGELPTLPSTRYLVTFCLSICTHVAVSSSTALSNICEAPTSALLSRVPNGGVPVEAPSLHVSKQEFHHCPFGLSLPCSSWLICGLLRSPAPCTLPPAVLPVQSGAPIGGRAGCLRVEWWALGPRTAVTVSRPHGL